MKDVIVNFQVLPLDLPSFYLFGATENILIQNSKINVKISKVLAESALICFKCDLHATQSALIFIGVGSNISGLVLIGKSYITLESCSIQSRLSGKMVGGLVMQSNKITVNLKDSNLTSYFNGNGSVGALISFTTNTTQIQSSNVKMCTNIVKNIGSGESFVTFSGGITQNCQICGNMKYSYGICTSSQDNSEEIDYKLVCKPVFVFDGEACSCQDGKVLNGSSCINILEATSHLLNQFESFDLSLRQIDAKLFDKIFALTQSTTDQINQVSSSTPSFNARLDTQSGVSTDIYQRYLELNEAIQQFVLKIKCGRQYSYAYVNNQCQYVKCSISGQYAINGVCQCPIQNMLIIGNACTCPINSSLINNACTCPINSSLINNACTCTVTGQVVKNGACQCEVTGAVVSGSTCVCPINSIVIGNMCFCTVSGQILLLGTCTCKTSGAFIYNGACSCGTNGLNISNTCSCPTYSSLVGNACICSGVIGISMKSGSCQCSPGYSVVNGFCQYIIDNTGITCSQSSYATKFDIQAITHSVINLANYSSGYVFKTATVITNAFIDISNNVYTTTVQPLFQSQASFTNIKVQIGTQTVNSGSILTLATSIIITQMNIISTLNTQITVNSLKQLQILQNSTTTTNINNLLVNLSFAPSSGNITLINISSGVMNITGYQVLGIYQSTLNIAMVAFTVISQSTLRIYNVTFQPSAFIIGNLSSYFFIQIDPSNITFNNISVILGSVTQFQTLTSITSTETNQYQFSGLITIMGNGIVIIVTNLLYDCYQYLNADYVMQSGFIFSFQDQYLQFNVTFQNICIQQNFSSSTIQFTDSGLIGGLAGVLSMKQSSIIFTVQSNYDQMVTFGMAFGIFGVQNGKSELINLIVTMKVYLNTPKLGNFGFFATSQGGHFLIQNSTFKNYNITTQSQVGIICQNLNADGSVINTTVQSCNISAGSYVGGFFASVNNQDQQIQNSTIVNINITATGSDDLKYIGAMIGYLMSDGYFNAYFQNSSVISNNIQGISVTAGVIGQIDVYFLSFQPPPYNISIIDFLIMNNNISGNVFTSGIVAGFSSAYDSQILLLKNITLYGCDIYCIRGSCGGLVGTIGNELTQSVILTVKNITMQICKIYGSSYIAGFVAISQKGIQYTTLQIYNSTVTSIVLSGQNCGLVTGFLNGTNTFDIQTSKTTGNNFVNSTQIQNCASITSGISQSGC
ncbi:Conserved_hypothetical protein [Hexamita inflata]|uniref:Uncharacterized protein n=1 Tax=Hexamita inflata TaxID=28002 RepID=A0AA86NP80_9EUKA|nr:Conserved hypothetical protein [Hexamita inflata]